MPGGEKFEEAFSKGDIMRRLDILEQQIRAVQVGRSLQAATVGTGGVRIRGGVLRVQDLAGDDMFRAGGSPGEVFIRPDILGPLSRAVLAAGIYTDDVDLQVSLGDTANAWVDLFDSLGGEFSFGPTIPDVEISEIGKALVFHGALIGATILGSDNICDGFMSFEVTGATERAAGDVSQGVRIAEFSMFGGGTVSTGPYEASVATASVLTELNPGFHSFQAKYQTFSVGGLSAQFSRRWMVVVAF